MRVHNSKISTFLLGLGFIFTGCGNKNNSTIQELQHAHESIPNSDNQEPLESLVTLLSVESEAAVRLDVSSIFSGGSYKYSWTQSKGPIISSIFSASGPVLNFTAPSVSIRTELGITVNISPASSADDSAAQVSFTVFVIPPKDMTPPIVAISSPIDGAQVSGVINFAASASDNVGLIKVEFYVDGTLVNSDSSAPYSYTLDTTKLTDASHSLIAKAFDAANNQSEAKLLIIVKNLVVPPPPPPPPVANCDQNPNLSAGLEVVDNSEMSGFSSSGLAEGWSTNSDRGTNIAPSASPGCSTSSQAQKLQISGSPSWGMYFYQSVGNSLTVGETYKVFIRYRSDVSAAFFQISDGPHSFNGRLLESEFQLPATNGEWKSAQGQFKYSNENADQIRILAGSTGQIEVDELSLVKSGSLPPPLPVVDTTPPSITITSPSSGSNVSGVVNVAASASDNVGVVKVEFYLNGALRSTDSSAPYTYSLDTNTISNASHNVTAKAHDAAGNQKSMAISIIVDNSVPPPPVDSTAPSVAITSPASGATVSGSISIAASASDNVGVSKVEFLVDGALKSTDTSSPYSYNLDTKSLSNASHVLMARAHDAAGNNKSAQISVTVNNSVPPPPPAGSIIVSPGQTISSAITAAKAGNTIIVKPGTYSGFTLNKADIIVRSEVKHGAKLTSGISIAQNAHRSVVDGFYIDGGGIIAQNPQVSDNPVDVKVLNNHAYRSSYLYKVIGTKWTVEGNIFERVVWNGGGGDADYGRMFGTGHTFRRNFLFGTTYGDGQDIPPNGPHTDGIQYFGNNGEIFKNITIEENFFTDIFQGMLIADEDNNRDIENVIIRNNVFWGTKLPNTGNMHGKPSWGIYLGKFYGATNVTVTNNLLYNCGNFLGLNGAGMTATIGKNMMIGNGSGGTAYQADEGADKNKIINSGNMIWNISTGDLNYTQDTKNVNPGFENEPTPLGPDGIPFTADDGWRSNATTQGFGPQI